MYQLTPSVRVLERHDWHARQPRAVTIQQAPHQAFIHHGAETDREARSVTRLDLAEQAMREIQDFHMDDPAHRWSDIAYHYVVFQDHGAGTLLAEGRLVRHVPAAQLNHNTGTLAVCVFGTIDADDQLQDHTVYAITQLLAKAAAAKTGVTALLTVGGHRDVTQTSCPGDMLYRALPRIAKGAHLELFK